MDYIEWQNELMRAVELYGYHCVEHYAAKLDETSMEKQDRMFEAKAAVWELMKLAPELRQDARETTLG